MAPQHFYPEPNEEVLYNIARTDPAMGWLKSGIPLFRSSPNVEHISDDERSAIVAKLFEAVYGFLNKIAVPAFDEVLWEEVFGFSSVQADCRDRTVELGVSPFPLLTDDFITVVQNEVLNQFPLWRVVVRPVDEFAICIYPDEMKLWPPFVADDGLSPLAIWRDRANRLIIHQKSDDRRQLAWIRAALPHAVATSWNSDAKWKFVGGFRSYDGDDGLWSLWFLVSGPTGYEVVFGGDESAHGLTLAVASNGHLKRYCQWVYDQASPFECKHEMVTSEASLWVEQVVLPAGIGKLCVLDGSTRRQIADITVLEESLNDALSP